MGRKVLVIGLDSAPPELVFEKLLGELPNIKKMVENGVCGKLETCHPPITIPAWMVMVTSKNPGKLGLYGFRHRKNHSYVDGWVANSYLIKDDTVWDILSKAGKKVCLVGVPPGYPPKPVNGCSISCFITPDTKKDFTYPPELKKEIEQLVGEYMFDVVFRTEERDKLLSQLYEMTEKRFTVIKYLMTKKVWDFFMFVEIGVDRLHHAFWKFSDRTHPKYVPGNKYETAIKDFYRFIDGKIGELLSLIDNDTIVFVVSDHGTRGMKGAFCVNEWLIKEGHLVLRSKPESIIELEKADIDWSKTKAWGWGGYYARIFLNVKGRESTGVIDPADYDNVRDELAEKLMELRDPNGRRMDTKVFKPEELYSQCNGDSPDLMVYFDNLYWRSAGTIGHNSLYLSENDTGPDDSVHSMQGIFIMYDPSKKYNSDLGNVSILDVAPTILHLMELPVPRDMEGKVIKEVLK